MKLSASLLQLEEELLLDNFLQALRTKILTLNLFILVRYIIFSFTLSILYGLDFFIPFIYLDVDGMPFIGGCLYFMIGFADLGMNCLNLLIDLFEFLSQFVDNSSSKFFL